LRNPGQEEMSFPGERYQQVGEGLREGVDKQSRRSKGRVLNGAEESPECRGTSNHLPTHCRKLSI
jgi:hypothetical protein